MRDMSFPFYPCRPLLCAPPGFLQGAVMTFDAKWRPVGSFGVEGCHLRWPAPRWATVPLQWGRVTNDAERARFDRTTADIRGLQWGRVMDDAETNVDLHGRKRYLDLLQWGRVMDHAETA